MRRPVAQFLGRAAPLAGALETFERGSQALPVTVDPATASFYAVNPLARQGAATRFATHPPIAERAGPALGATTIRPLGVVA